MKNIYLVLMLVLIGLIANGQTTFQKTYAGLASNQYSIEQTSDGGYIICGTSYNDTSTYGYLIKTNSNGDTLWTKGYIGNQSCFYSAIQTNDGGYIAVGFIWLYNGEISIVRTDSNGDTLWTKYLAGNEWMTGTQVIKTSDGGFMILGWDQMTIGNNPILGKMDSSGNFSWIYGFGFGDGSDETVPYSIQQTIDGGYIIAGYSGGWGPV